MAPASSGPETLTFNAVHHQFGACYANAGSISITKTASTATATPGATVHYTITVTDSGQTPYTGATVTDSLAGVLGDAAYNGGAAGVVQRQNISFPS